MVQSSRFRRNYVQALSYALHHRVLILTLTVVTTVTPLLLYRAGAIGVEFFPDGDAPWIEVNFELPLGSSMEKRTAQVAREVEAAVLRAVRPEEWNSDTPDGQPVKPVTLLGRPDALNINLQESTNAGPEFGKVYVELSLPGTRQRDSEAIRAAIEREMPPLPGVTVRTVAFKEGPPSGRPIGVRILGQNATYEELEVLADQIEAILRSVPGAKDVVTDYRLRQEIEVEPNRVMSRIFDIDAADIASSVHFALEGLKVGEVDFGRDETIDIRLRNRPGDRDEVEDLANLPIRSPTGKVVALEQVASIERRAGANVLKHYDSQRVINVECDLHEGVLTDDVKLALVQALRPDLSTAQQRALTLDRQNKIISSTDKVTIEFGGENEIRDDALEDLTMAMILAMGIILIILVVEFNSFIQAFIVLFTVPLSLVGVGLGLMVCGMNFSVAAMIGVVALAGVVVDNAVVLLDFINRLRDAGLPLDKAVTYAGSLRLRPILANTVTTVGGMLPMAMNLSGGSEFFQPLTIAFIFGLLFADALTLLVLPIAVYSLDARKRASWLDPMLREDLVGQPPQAPQPLPAPLTALADAVRNVVQPAPALSPALAPTLAPALAALAAAANPSPSPTAALPAAPTPPAPSDADQPQPLRHFHDADERRRPRRL
jgi:HAE1 family hydrophobic/amphiphilic exporter-1